MKNQKGFILFLGLLLGSIFLLVRDETMLHYRPMGWTKKDIRAFVMRPFRTPAGHSISLKLFFDRHHDMTKAVILWVDFNNCRVYNEYFKIFNQLNDYALPVRLIGIIGNATPEMIATFKKGNHLNVTLWADPYPSWKESKVIPDNIASFLVVLEKNPWRVSGVDWHLPLTPNELGVFPWRLVSMARVPIPVQWKTPYREPNGKQEIPLPKAMLNIHNQ